MMKVKYYKCPVCSKKFKTLNGWGNHMDTTHPSERPEGYSTSRFFYFVMTGKTNGICRTCKQSTEWNEQSMKYDQYCKNPECKQAYVKIAKQRMIGKYGQVHLLNSPDMQRKMLEHRKISGKYKFYDGTEFEYVGSYEKEFLKMMNTLLQWHTNDIMAPSPHTYYYNYKNPKDKSNEGVKFYIPDFYIPSLNLEVEIKQQTSGNKAMNDINRVKETLKDEVMMSNKEINYIKINDNNFTGFFEFLMKAQEYLPTTDNIKKNQMDLVIESYNEPVIESHTDPVITKTFEIFDHDGYSNQCVILNNYNKPLRGRSEILIIKDDMVFLSMKKEGCNSKYSIPGGGWDINDKDHKESAIREAQEEVRINTKNVIPTGLRIEYDVEPPKWMKNKFDKKDWWYGYYVEIYVGEYDSKFTGKISAHDKDSMINTGKFYKISDVYDMLRQEHQKAIDIIMHNQSSIATEGLLSFLGFKKDKSVNTPDSWKNLFQIKKNFVGSFGMFSGVKIENNMIEIHGINFNTLQMRIKRFYDDKSINNIFIPKYNAMSYKKFERKKIERKDIKIDYMTTPEFFALELVNLFTDLGRRYNDNLYLKMASQIYDKSWLKEADNKAESSSFLDTKNLKNISLELNSYQKEFIQKYPVLKAQLNLNGYILAFEQGLGKTLTAIGLSECLNVDHVYIVCPNSLKENWALEIKKYFEKYEDDDLWRQEVFICSDKPLLFHPDTTKYMIINNESIEKMYPYVMSGKNMLILDESHNFRNLKSKRVGQLLELKNKLKCVDTLVMSGTPIKATPDEIVPALMLIDPTFTITAAECFSKAFKLTSSLGTSLVQTRFGKIMYRKEKDVLENKLLEKHVDTLSVSISDKQKYTMTNVNETVINRFSEIYDNGIKDAMKLRQPFMEFSEKYSPNPDRFNEFKKLINDMVKKEIYLHEIDQIFVEKYMKGVTEKIPNKDDKNLYIFYIKNFVRYKAHCLGVAFGEILPKYRRDMFISMYSENTNEFYKMIKENPKKTLIFTQFKGVANYIYQDLCNNDIGSVCITGDVKDRMSVLRAFKENDSVRVLVATSQTIGTGVTLVEANQMFFFGPPWRQSDFDQCSDRIHRIGQTDEVYIYSVILDTGAELNLSTRMDDILVWSKKMTDSVIHTSKDDENIEENNFEELLKAEESYTGNTNNVLEKIKKFNKELATYEYIVVQSDGTHSESFKNYKILSPSDFNKHHGGICWDYVAYEASKFSFCKYKTFFFCLVDKDGNPKHTHTFLLFYLNDKVFWFEASWKSHIGIFEYDDEDSALSSIISLLMYGKQEKDFYIVEYKPSTYVGNTDVEFTTAMAKLPEYKYKTIEKPKKNTIQSINVDKNGKVSTEAYIENLLSTNIVQESYILSKDDIVLHLDDFISGKSNILLITGISRSGKTTMSHDLAKKYNAEIIHIDSFENYYCIGDEDSSEYGINLRNKWFTTPVGKKYKEICDDDPDKITNEELSSFMKDAVMFIIKMCNIHCNKRFIIEGLQIYADVNADILNGCPIIIKGTSMLKSFSRRGRKTFDNLKFYIQSEKELNEFRKSISIETFITDDETLNEFLCINKNE